VAASEHGAAEQKVTESWNASDGWLVMEDRRGLLLFGTASSYLKLMRACSDTDTTVVDDKGAIFQTGDRPRRHRLYWTAVGSGGKAVEWWWAALADRKRRAEVRQRPNAAATATATAIASTST
jgi:hypothetical protein